MSELKKLYIDDVQGLTVSSKVLAALFNMTDCRVRDLKSQDIVVKEASLKLIYCKV